MIIIKCFYCIVINKIIFEINKNNNIFIFVKFINYFFNKKYPIQIILFMFFIDCLA